jgi:hypothetical protein
MPEETLPLHNKIGENMEGRRGFLKSLVAGTAVAGLPPVKEVNTLNVTEHDAVVLKFKELLSAEKTVRLISHWNQYMPGIKCIVLGDGADIEVVRNIKT